MSNSSTIPYRQCPADRRREWLEDALSHLSRTRADIATRMTALEVRMGIVQSTQCPTTD